MELGDTGAPDAGLSPKDPWAGRQKQHEDQMETFEQKELRALCLNTGEAVLWEAPETAEVHLNEPHFVAIKLTGDLP